MMQVFQVSASKTVVFAIDVKLMSKRLKIGNCRKSKKLVNAHIYELFILAKDSNFDTMHPLDGQGVHF